jgi:hypothetical protein
VHPPLHWEQLANLPLSTYGEETCICMRKKKKSDDFWISPEIGAPFYVPCNISFYLAHSACFTDNVFVPSSCSSCASTFSLGTAGDPAAFYLWGGKLLFYAEEGEI